LNYQDYQKLTMTTIANLNASITIGV